MLAPLLELPLPTLPPALAQIVASSDCAAYSKQLADCRHKGLWSPRSVLEQAHGALQLGLIEQADGLVVEADALQPEWGIVPDRWGLWPIVIDQIATSDEAERQGCLQLVDDYLLLRHLPAIELWRCWLAAVQEDWRQAAEPKQLSVMGLLLGRSEQLPARLEPALEQLIGETQIAADPSAALAVWAPLSRRLPQWSYARLKAADLSLKLEQLNSCDEHLGAATAEQRQLPWLCDIEARLSMARKQPTEALRCWEEAIRLAGASGDEELAELFRQRRREGEWEAEWMVETPVFSSPSGNEVLDRFAERLEAWAVRAGVELQSTPNSSEPDPEAFAEFLDQATGRLALAG